MLIHGKKKREERKQKVFCNQKQNCRQTKNEYGEYQGEMDIEKYGLGKKKVVKR